jgi:hypothetical protein
MSLQGVLATGVYGSGKSSVVEEIAGLLEDAGLSYGAIDFDWLKWFDAEGDDLRVASSWLAASTGVGIEEVTVANDRPIRETALEIVKWLGWPPTRPAATRQAGGAGANTGRSRGTR